MSKKLNWGLLKTGLGSLIVFLPREVSKIKAIVMVNRENILPKYPL
jgi:hypothetical protein